MGNDLISRSALRSLAYHVTDNIIGVERCVIDWEDIEDAPAVDAVEVTRCRECKFYETNVEYYGGGTKDICRFLKRQTQEDDFCSYGERRADDG